MSEAVDRVIHLLNLPRIHESLLPLTGIRAMTGPLKFGAGLIKVDATNPYFYFRNLADTAYGDIYTNQCRAARFYPLNVGMNYFDSPAINRYYIFRSQDAYGLWEVAKLYYGYFQLFRARLHGDLDVSANNVGPLLIDRTTATKYRLYVDNGVLDIEAV